MHPPPTSTLFPYTTLFRSPRSSHRGRAWRPARSAGSRSGRRTRGRRLVSVPSPITRKEVTRVRSEEHTSELQSHVNLVCRLLLEKKKTRRGTDRRTVLITI